MISHELREFVDRVMDRHAIDDEDVKMLQREILLDSVMSRDVVDVLIALDRAVAESSTSFADYLVALVVDFAVWESRPTGLIDRDKAHWLVATLSSGNGPTQGRPQRASPHQRAYAARQLRIYESRSAHPAHAI
jgi:hypothetical protein